MEITYRIVGLKKLQEAVAAAPGAWALRSKQALDYSVAVVKGAVVAGEVGGPGHFGYHLRDRWSTRVEIGSGRSLQSRGIVSTDAPQGRWLEFGTKAHEIAPKKGTALRIAGLGTGGDQYASIIHHPGEKATHAARKALATTKPAIKQFFAEAVEDLAKSMATEGD